MNTSYSTVTFLDNVTFDFRALTLPEISSIVRDFRDELAPMVSQAADLTVTRGSSRGSQDTVKQAIQCTSAIANRLLSVASDGQIDAAMAATLPIPAKVEAIGVIIRLILETIPIEKLITSLAFSMIATTGSHSSSQFVQSVPRASALN